MREFTLADAKNRFGKLVHAARVTPIAVTKYDRPFIVVMAVEEFERLKALNIHKVRSGAEATQI